MYLVSTCRTGQCVRSCSKFTSSPPRCSVQVRRSGPRPAERSASCLTPARDVREIRVMWGWQDGDHTVEAYSRPAQRFDLSQRSAFALRQYLVEEADVRIELKVAGCGTTSIEEASVHVANDFLAHGEEKASEELVGVPCVSGCRFEWRKQP